MTCCLVICRRSDSRTAFNGFDEFYANNSGTIQRVIKSQEDEDSEQEEYEDSEQEEYEDSDFQVNDDDSLVTGQGLADAVDRLSTLYSSRERVTPV